MKEKELEKLKEEISSCKLCPLYRTRLNPVLGSGYVNAKIMLIGEAPGENEDREGLAFIGRSGKLLTEILTKAGINREETYISNIVRCRPPENRDPSDAEVTACKKYIFKQIDIINPEVVITVGRIALRTLLNDDSLKKEKVTKIRGNIYNFCHNGKSYKAMPTLHPAYILRNRTLIDSYVGDFLKAKSLCGSPTL